MTDEQQSADEVARVKAIQDNAKRLGLTWDRTVATITQESPLQGVLDGDTEQTPIGLISTIGPLVIGDRVYIDRIPPAANFVSGWAIQLPAYRWTALGVTLLGGTNNFQTPSAVQENVGPWTFNTSTFYASVPQSGRYAIRVTVITNTGGVANSRQAIVLDVTTSVPNMPNTYRNMWTVGEQSGTMTVAPVTLNKGDSMRLNFLQNSAGSMAGSVYFEATREAGV
jgi:hypothetical protein